MKTMIYLSLVGVFLATPLFAERATKCARISDANTRRLSCSQLQEGSAERTRCERDAARTQEPNDSRTQTVE